MISFGEAHIGIGVLTKPKLSNIYSISIAANE